ncbi:MarR family winged helix-turn-helix transcriptional regulator [Pseudonocardia kunmingensis]|uniref:MarR family transcriptional regulator n=1 Tax=Pseudonocardia kunmingensis TaxID=630975 RepID=A0A543E213_9PSEU|nr:MarR family transcriptional regulator [Pseudonocardia kunmingensis]TQM15620.1 MarR family transcriptional regulator [Pseudonocardia kunmingensis]
MAQAGPARSTPLDEQLCFALYAASRAMTSCYRPMLDALDLTYPQYLVLLVLWERGDTTVSGLGRALQLETGTLSPLLKRLEAAGLISRTRQVDDERSVRVSLTAEGRGLEDSVAATQGRVGAATAMSRAERGELREALHRLTDTLRTAAGAG